MPRPSAGAGRVPIDAPPARRFRDADYAPLADTLADLRARIDDIDKRVVALLAQRALYVRDATRFKRDAGQVVAPERQAEVFDRVRALAAAHAPCFPDLPDVVEAAYRALVAGFVAAEHRFFTETEPFDSDA